MRIAAHSSPVTYAGQKSAKTPYFVEKKCLTALPLGGAGRLGQQRRGQPPYCDRGTARPGGRPGTHPPPATPARRIRISERRRPAGHLRPLEGLGIEPVLTADHGATTGFYYEDPDRNSVELLADNFGDWKKSTEYLRTSTEFAANPMGAYVDPDAMIAARAAGASVEEVHRRAYAGEFPPSKPMDPRVLL